MTLIINENKRPMTFESFLKLNGLECSKDELKCYGNYEVVDYLTYKMSRNPINKTLFREKSRTYLFEDEHELKVRKDKVCNLTLKTKEDEEIINVLLTHPDFKF